jgi:hypothetical protein
VTSREEEYRHYARQCLEIAPTFQDEERRATLLDLARAWLRLAHLAQANRHVAELTVQIVRQRVIVKYALDTGQRSEMAESLLDALEGSLRLFEKHRIFLLGCVPTVRVKKSTQASRPTRLAPGRADRYVQEAERHMQAAAIAAENAGDTKPALKAARKKARARKRSQAG